MWPFKNQKTPFRKKKFPSITKRLFSAADSKEIWAKWDKSSRSIDNVIFEDQLSLVGRSREQFANNDYVVRYVELSKTNIIGENGIIVNSRVKSGDEPDIDAQNAIEEYWNEWSEGVDPSGEMGRAEFEQSVIQSWIVDGEAFVYEREGNRFNGGVAYSLIDPILCPILYNDDNQYIRFGIKYSDSSMEIPVSYFFHKTKPVTSKHYNYPTSDLIEISASKIIHIFSRDWVGQKRGIPKIATGLGTLKNLDGFEEAAIINARVGAAKMGFFYTENGGEYEGDTDSSGNVIMEATPGSFEMLPEGVRLADWQPDFPSSLYGTFTSDALRRVAVGWGVSHHSLTGDMTGVNYTSSRTALLDERDNWKVKQNWFIGRLTKKMYNRVISLAISTGRIQLPPKPVKDYLKASFQGRRWQWVDPAKEMIAAEKAVAIGVRSRADIIRETGKEPSDVWQELEKESEMSQNIDIETKMSTIKGEKPDEEAEDDSED